MCLYSNKIKAKKAKEDIKAYKIYINLKNNKYLPPFYSMFTNPLLLKNNDIIKGQFKTFKKLWKWILKREGNVYSIYTNKYCIEDGFIHTYTNKYTCTHEIENYMIMNQLIGAPSLPSLVMFEVSIPKNTYYYESFSGETLCSRKIRIVKQIK